MKRNEKERKTERKEEKQGAEKTNRESTKVYLCENEYNNEIHGNNNVSFLFLKGNNNICNYHNQT